MRKVNIELDLDSVVSVSTRNIGYVGEHNATELVIKIPQSCIDDAECFVLNFNDGVDDVISNIITDTTQDDGAWVDEDTIHCVLWQQLTRGKYLSVTVEGYAYQDGVPKLIFKFPRIDDLRLKPANIGCINKTKELKGIQGQINNILSSIQKKFELISSLDKDDSKVTAVDHYADLPSDADDGAVSIVLNDDTQGSTIIDRIGLYVKQTNGWVLVDRYADDIAQIKSTLSSYSNISSMAHTHTNLSVLAKISENSNGTLTYDGEDVGGDITVVDRYANLSNDAELGETAIVLYDDTQETAIQLDGTVEITAGTTIAPSETIAYREDAFDSLVQACADSGSGAFTASLNVAHDVASDEHKSDPAIFIGCTPLDVHDVGGLDLEETLYVRASGAEQKYAITLISDQGSTPTGMVDIAAVYVFSDTPNAMIGVDGFGYLEQDLQAGWSVVTVGFDNEGEILGLASVRHVDSIADVFGFVVPVDYSVNVSSGADSIMTGVVSVVVLVPRRGLYVKQTDGWAIIDPSSEKIEAYRSEFDAFAAHVDSQMETMASDISGHTTALASIEDAIPTSADIEEWNNASAASHKHSNKRTLDRFYGTTNSLIYNEMQVPLVAKDDVKLLALKEYNGLVVRDEELSDSISDVPFYSYGYFALVDTTGADPELYDLIEWRQDVNPETGAPVRFLRAVLDEAEYCYYPAAIASYPAGWSSSGVSVEAPSFDGFSPNVYKFGDYDEYSEIGAMPEEAVSLLRSLSQCINEYAPDMGTIIIPDGSVEIFCGTLKPNHNYRYITNNDFALELPMAAWDSGYQTICLTINCTSDVVMTLQRSQLINGSSMSILTAGYHTVVFTYFPMVGKWLIKCEREDGSNENTDTLVPLALNTDYTSLQIRQNWTDVPIYLVDENAYRIGLQTSTESSADLIRVYEATDFASGLPCPMLRVEHDGYTYIFVPRSFTSASDTFSAGWYDTEGNAISTPSLSGMTFGALDVCGTKYTSLSNLPVKAQLALETISRIFNISTDAMGSLGIIEDGVQRFQGDIAINRKYAFSPADTAVLTLPVVPWTTQDAQFVLYLSCSADADFTFPSGTLFAGGEAPNTDAGEHKLIGSWLPDAEAWAVGGVDYAEATA